MLIRVFLALSNLMGDGQDVAAYCWQIVDQQEKIIQASGEQAGPDGPYQTPGWVAKRVALGPYLHGVLREETHANYDDAQRAFAQVVAWEPRFSSGLDDLQRVQSGCHSARGNGVLYVFALVGRGPYKEEVCEEPTSAALLIADRILSVTGKHTLPPTIAPVKVPMVVVAQNTVQGVLVHVDDQPRAATETITHVGEMAVLQHQAAYPSLIARAVVRRVVKKGVIYAGKDLLGPQNDAVVSLAMDVTGVVWEATESADTRCWGLLPETIQVARIELPAGQHQVALQPVGGQRLAGAGYVSDVSIEDGRNTYVLANFPDLQLVGQVLTSHPGLR